MDLKWDSINNLTVLSILEIVFGQLDYRQINFYTENTQNEILHKIIQTACESMKPVVHLNLNEFVAQRTSFGFPILNVLAAENITRMKSMNHSRYPSIDVTLIWLTLFHEDLTESVLQEWKKMGVRVMVLTHSYLVTLSVYKNEPSERIGITPFSAPMVQQFIRKYFSTSFLRRGANLTIFTEFNAPKSELTAIDDSYYFIGPDGSLSEYLVEWLNVTPIFSSSVGTKHPAYKTWLNGTFLSPRLIYQHYHSEVLTKNRVTIFNDSLIGEFDIQMTSFPDQGINFTKRIKLQTEPLYPHDIDCFSVVVPELDVQRGFLFKLVKNGHIQTICIALGAFTALRITLQKSLLQIFPIVIETLGVFLNQAKMENDNQLKVAWDINLRAFSVLATTALSAIIFKSLVHIQKVEINSVDDLIASNLTIYAPDYLKHQEIWSHLRPDLQSKIVYKDANFIQREVVVGRTLDFAYLYPKSKAEYLTMMANFVVPAGEKSKHRVRLMKETIHCGLASYRISPNSPLQSYVNDFIRRCLENGLYDKHLEWMRNLNMAVLQVNKKKATKTEHIILTMEMVYGIFLVYLHGLVIATVTLVAEIFTSHLARKKKVLLL